MRINSICNSSDIFAKTAIVKRWVLFFLAGITIFITSCSKEKKLNEKLTFWKNDKIPYGTFYAYENLKRMFPGVEISINKTSPDKYHLNNLEELTNDGSDSSNPGESALIIISPVVAPDRRELQAMMNYISEGNHIFISAMEFSDNLLDSLRLKAQLESGFDSMEDSLTLSLIHPIENDTTSFAYPGLQLDNYLRKFDNNITQVLGYNHDNKPNFVKFTYDGGGSLFIQLAPAAFTNFFLLHKNNKIYYDQALSYLPPQLDEVIWDEYFRYHRNGSGNENNDFSAFSWMMKQPALAWTLWLLLLLFLLIYLFESKRKQRAIPLKPSLKNASVDFVQTIGRLYFQRKDNKNLAGKMITHFLEQVRQHYNITTSSLDQNFEKKLSYKSGHTAEEVKDLVQHIKIVQERPLVSDELLLAFNQKLDKFKTKFKDGR
ncbi:DUF4350 domain-containing protein [Flavitalea sp.]|nr:DUF4350 domain-containing protein [Flavitalea sp.]